VAVAEPGSDAAHHSFLEPQACLHQAASHCITPDLLQRPMKNRPRAGLPEAELHRIRGDLVWLYRFMGFKHILISRKSILSLKNYYKSIFCLKNTKPFTKIF
jgi:hypothetical protein